MILAAQLHDPSNPSPRTRRFAWTFGARMMGVMFQAVSPNPR